VPHVSDIFDAGTRNLVVDIVPDGDLLGVLALGKAERRSRRCHLYRPIS
jgi:hypothetical protein